MLEGYFLREFSNYYWRKVDPAKSNTVGDPKKKNIVMTEVISSSSNRITNKKLEGSANFHQWMEIVESTLTARN